MKLQIGRLRICIGARGGGKNFSSLISLLLRSIIVPTSEPVIAAWEAHGLLHVYTASHKFRLNRKRQVLSVGRSRLYRKNPRLDGIFINLPEYLEDAKEKA